MRIKTTVQVISVAVFFVFVVGGGFYFLLTPRPNTDQSLNSSDTSFGWKYPVVKFPLVGDSKIAYSDIRDPGGVPKGLPVRLKIPAIGVDSAIEDALITSDGRMDVPSGSVDVAWFALGPHPGQRGSAVIGGHFGISNNVPFVFYKLDVLKEGDKIYIENDKGDTLAFVVRAITLFDRNADATDVFTSQDGLAHLNLITCEGIWNQVNGTYPQRRVVFTDVIPAENEIVPKAEAMNTFYRSLGIGTSGTDVAALQTVLEQKGFLLIPPGTSKGFFGTRTRTALIKYQTFFDLPRVGTFGPLTRARLVLDLVSNPVLPDTGTEEFVTSGGIKKPSSPLQNSIQFIKSLYVTPMDGLITTLLLVSIVLMIITIVKRL